MTEPIPTTIHDTTEFLTENPTEIKRQFEQELGVFGSHVDNPYKMLGLPNMHQNIEEIRDRLHHIATTYSQDFYDASFQKAEEIKKKLEAFLSSSDEADPIHQQTKVWIEQINARFPNPTDNQTELKSIIDRIADAQDFLLNPVTKRTVDANIYLRNPIEKSGETQYGTTSFAISKGTSKLDVKGTPGLKEHCEDTAGFRRTKNGEFSFTSDGISNSNGWLMSEALEQAFQEIPQSSLESLTEESLNTDSVHKIILFILDQTKKYLQSKDVVIDTGATFSFTAVVGDKLVSFELGDSSTLVVPRDETESRLSNTPHNVIDQHNQPKANQINGYITYEQGESGMELRVVTPTTDLRGAEYAEHENIEDLSRFFIETRLNDGDMVIKTTDGLLKGEGGTEEGLIASLKTKSAEEHIRLFVSNNPGTNTERDDTSLIKYIHRKRINLYGETKKQEISNQYKESIDLALDTRKSFTQQLETAKHQPYLSLPKELDSNTPVYVSRLVEPNPNIPHNPTYSIFEETKASRPIKIEPRTIVRVGDDFIFIDQQKGVTTIHKFQAINPEDHKSIYEEKLSRIFAIASSFETGAGAFTFLNTTLNQLSRRKHWYHKIQEKFNGHHDSKTLLKNIEYYLNSVWTDSRAAQTTQNHVLGKKIPEISFRNLNGELTDLRRMISQKRPHSDDPSKGTYFPESS